MELIDLASAHLETIRTRINELMQQSQQIGSEVQRLNEILEEGSRLVDNTVTPSSNSNV